MKKAVLVFTIMVAGIAAHSQEMKGDTLITSTGEAYYVGMDIQLGRGDRDNGDFKYIGISSGSWATVAGAMNGVDMTKDGIGRRWNGYKCKVKKIVARGSKKRGYVYYLILGNGGLAHFDCDIESALATGEVRSNINSTSKK
jgi:hypothetical protein